MSSNEYSTGAELRRRMRGVLSMFRSIASHMAAHAESSQESVRHLSGRIGAIGRAALAPELRGMDLEWLVLDELRARAAPIDRIRVSGPSVRLDIKSAQFMSLALHEIATNAVKYGALGQSAGSLQVSWWLAREADSRRLQFEWLEEGVKIDSVGRHPGFGSELLERLIANELKGVGKMVFSDVGVRCSMTIPLGESLENDG